MLFELIENGTYNENNLKPGHAYLIEDNWNDWYKYKTLFNLVYRSVDNKVHYLGGVKIGKFGMTPSSNKIVRTQIPKFFHQLTTEYFSLGQDVEYYSRLNDLGEELKYTFLKSLKDIALDEELFENSLYENVMGESLLRSVNRASVKGQLRRLARGDALLTHYKFKYVSPPGDFPYELSFEVTPASNPPSNVHVLIGRNGVGKTRLLGNMTNSLLVGASLNSQYGTFSSELEGDNNDFFANLVSVSFSAFDRSAAIEEKRNNSEGMRYSYIGLKAAKLLNNNKSNKFGENKSNEPNEAKQIVNIIEEASSKEEAEETHTLKSLKELQNEFIESLIYCMQGARKDRWVRAVSMLESDPVFEELGITGLPNYEFEEMKKVAKLVFDKLSSGHKIVLLTITKLVEKVEEKTVVLLDEPEAHLHPPLLSAFVRALSDLLIYRNGVALIATHSPVIVQETPRSCVWMMRRKGAIVNIDRPELETFGENIGAITREVFKLEVTHSGFHKLISDAFEKYSDYESVIQYFNGELGMEAKAILRSMTFAEDEGK